jgi:hypothetical protein
MHRHNNVLLPLFVFSLFSLAAAQIGFKLNQAPSSTQVLGVNTSNGLTCTDLYNFYTQKCQLPTVPRVANKPDLTISNITIEKVMPPLSPCPQYKYTVEVKNIGTEPAVKSMLKTHISPSVPQAIDNCLRSRPYEGSLSPIPGNNLVHTDTLLPGAIEQYSDYFNPSVASNIIISAAIDSENNVAESNDSNNLLSKNYSLDAIWAPPTAPTAAPADACRSETARCLNATTYQVCSNGKWVAYSCPSNRQCAGNGHCLPTVTEPVNHN